MEGLTWQNSAEACATWTIPPCTWRPHARRRAHATGVDEMLESKHWEMLLLLFGGQSQNQRTWATVGVRWWATWWATMDHSRRKVSVGFKQCQTPFLLRCQGSFGSTMFHLSSYRNGQLRRPNPLSIFSDQCDPRRTARPRQRRRHPRCRHAHGRRQLRR